MLVFVVTVAAYALITFNFLLVLIASKETQSGLEVDEAAYIGNGG